MWISFNFKISDIVHLKVSHNMNCNHVYGLVTQNTLKAFYPTFFLNMEVAKLRYLPIKAFLLLELVATYPCFKQDAGRKNVLVRLRKIFYMD